MSRNGQLSLSPSAKAAAEKYRANAFLKAMNICKFNNPQQDIQVAGLCRDSWIAGYFYAKQEENRSPSSQIQYDIKDYFKKIDAIRIFEQYEVIPNNIKRFRELISEHVLAGFQVDFYSDIVLLFYPNMLHDSPEIRRRFNFEQTNEDELIPVGQHSWILKAETGKWIVMSAQFHRQMTLNHKIILI